MRCTTLAALLMAALSAAAVAEAGLDGAWIDGATPTNLWPPNPVRKCVCAPDPLLPDPQCILCLCNATTNSTALNTPAAPVRCAARSRPPPAVVLNAGKLLNVDGSVPGAQPARAVLHAGVDSALTLLASPRPTKWPFTPSAAPSIPRLQRPPSKACGSLVGNATQLHYSTGAKNICTCGPDPFLKGDPKGASWILCKCPNASWPRNNTLGIPTTATYTNWPTADMASPPQPSWPRCSGKYALCSSANCTLVSGVCEWEGGREGTWTEGDMEGGREKPALPARQPCVPPLRTL